MNRQWIVFGGFLLGIWSCKESTTAPDLLSPTKITIVDSSLKTNFFQENEGNSTDKLAFLPLLDSSYYTSRDSFANAFKKHYQVPNTSSLLGLQVSHLYGAADSIFWLRFNNNTQASNCAYPLKEQHFIFDHHGKLLYQNYVHSAHFLDNAIDSTPIYLTIEHTCEGEGRHHAYILQEEQLVDVLNVFFENMPITFDCKEDSSVFQAAGALKPLLTDVNKDGHNDLLLQGKRLQLYGNSGKRFSIQRPYRRDLVQYYFLYEPTKEIFIYAPSFSIEQK